MVTISVEYVDLSSYFINGIATDGARLCAVGSNICITSDDYGATWQEQTIPAGTYAAITWNGTNWIAVGTNVIAVSSDATSWHLAVWHTAYNLYAVAYSGTSVVATGYACGVRSIDSGENWIDVSAIPAVAHEAIAYLNSRYITTGIGLELSESDDDGDTFIAQLPVSIIDYTSVVAANGVFFANCALGSYYATSSNGDVWTETAWPSPWIITGAVAFKQGYWFGYGIDSSLNTAIFYSSDIVSWNSVSVPSIDSYANTVFVDNAHGFVMGRSAGLKLTVSGGTGAYEMGSVYKPPILLAGGSDDSFPFTARYVFNLGITNAGLFPAFIIFQDAWSSGIITPPSTTELGNGLYYFDWTWYGNPSTDQDIVFQIDCGSGLPDPLRSVGGFISVKDVYINCSEIDFQANMVATINGGFAATQGDSYDPDVHSLKMTSDTVNRSLDHQEGKQTIVTTGGDANRLVIYDRTNTELMKFDLKDKNGDPASSDPYTRIPVP
jgi:hypothetical protein